MPRFAIRNPYFIVVVCLAPAVIGIHAASRMPVDLSINLPEVVVATFYNGMTSPAMQLAQGRYDLSLASIVELTQAQLNITEAEIENLNGRYDYQTQYSALQYAIGLLR
jgi:hypothetical protein